MRNNIFVFSMQADDIGDNQYQQNNVYHCVCLMNYGVTQIERINNNTNTFSLGELMH